MSYLKNIPLLIFITIAFLGCSKNDKQNPSMVPSNEESGNAQPLPEQNMKVTEEILSNVEYKYSTLESKIPGIINFFLFDQTLEKFKDLGKKKLLLDFRKKITNLYKYNDGFDVLPGANILAQSFEVFIRRMSPCSTEIYHNITSIHNKPMRQMCLSFYELAKLPESKINQEVIGAFLHQYAHDLGYGEDESIIIQKAFTNNFERMLIGGLQGLMPKIHMEITDDQPVVMGPYYFYSVDLLKALNFGKELNVDEKIKVCTLPDVMDESFSELINKQLLLINHFKPILIESKDLSLSEINEFINTMIRYQQELKSSGVELVQLCDSNTSIKVDEKFLKTSQKIQILIPELMEETDKIKKYIQVYH